MASICYKWNNSPFSWSNARLTWKDFCVIQNLLYQRVPYSKKRKWYDKYNQFEEKYETQSWEIVRNENEQEEKKENQNEIEKLNSDTKKSKKQKIKIKGKNLNETEKNALINLIISMDYNNNENFLKEQTKKKNSDIIIDIKNIEIIKTKNNTINLKIDFDEI